MKKLSAFVLAGLLASSASFAKTKTFDAFTSQDSSSPSGGNAGFFKRTGVGIASYEYAMLYGPAVSFVWPSMDENHTIQALVTIGHTSPFVFSLGGNYRYNGLGSLTAGFHWGGGLNVAKRQTGVTTTDTIGNIYGLFGPHFTVPSLSRILFMFDAGPMLILQPGTNDLKLIGLGQMLGFSVHYLF